MTVDREELKRKALRAIDAASESELRRGYNDKVYAESWLQRAIGFIAGLITIIGSLFSCLVSTVVVEHYGFDDRYWKIELLREFRDKYLLESGDDAKIDSVFAYYALAPHIIRWMRKNGDYETNFSTMMDKIDHAVNLIQRREHEKAFDFFVNHILTVRPTFFLSNPVSRRKTESISQDKPI